MFNSLIETFNFILSNFHWILLFIIFVILLLQIIAFTTVLTDGREISSKHSWILVLLIFPIFGFLLYYLFGRNTRNPGEKKIRQFNQDFKSMGIGEEVLSKLALDNINENWNDIEKLITFINNSGSSTLSTINNLEVLQNGNEKFERLLNDIRKAKHSIHMNYFIWRDDNLTRLVQDELIKLSQNGVEVRILVDHLGSFLTSSKYFKRFKQNNIKFEYSFSFKNLFELNKVNYRDHRKIVIIDGTIGYLGGINMAEEYIDGGKRFDTWRDTHIRIEGGQVKYLQSLFIESWKMFAGEDLKEGYFPIEDFISSEEKKFDIPLQIISSGPENEWNSIEKAFFLMIVNANKSIKLQSPYFVPSESLLTALKAAALSGVNVQIIMTGVPDKYLPFFAANRYIREVLEAGVKVYQYKRGFLHSKVLCIDSTFCTTGTTNMDLRSFRLNYEINAVIYDKNITVQLEDDFENDLKESVEITLNDEVFKNKFIRFRDEIIALLSPML